jgi:hypothetical protein
VNARTRKNRLTPERRGRNLVGPFSAILVVWLVLIGVIAFIGALVLSAFGSEWQSGDNGQAHALSKSAIGFAGVVELMRGTGRPVEISRTDRPPSRGRSLLILTANPDTDSKAIKDIRFRGPRLIVLPKWRAAPHQFHRGWVRASETYGPQQTVEPIKGYGGKPGLAQRAGKARHALVRADGSPLATTGVIRSLRTLTDGDWIPVIRVSDGGVVLARKGNIWVLSDPDLLNTQGVADLATARAGLALVDTARAGSGTIAFDVSLHGIKRERNLLQLLFQPPFLGATLALGMAALLLALQAFGRFGPPVVAARAFALGKQGLADNSAALIRMARREHRMVERYALYVRGEAARAVGAPHSLSESDLEAMMDRLSSQQDLTPFTHLRREAAAAHDIGTALTAARRLYHWRLEMTRERR